MSTWQDAPLVNTGSALSFTFFISNVIDRLYHFLQDSGARHQCAGLEHLPWLLVLTGRTVGPLTSSQLRFRAVMGPN